MKDLRSELQAVLERHIPCSDEYYKTPEARDKHVQQALRGIMALSRLWNGQIRALQKACHAYNDCACSITFCEHYGIMIRCLDDTIDKKNPCPNNHAALLSEGYSNCHTCGVLLGEDPEGDEG